MAIELRKRIDKATTPKHLMHLVNVAKDAAEQARFVNWPALAKSFEQDALVAEILAVQMKGKK